MAVLEECPVCSDFFTLAELLPHFQACHPREWSEGTFAQSVGHIKAVGTSANARRPKRHRSESCEASSDIVCPLCFESFPSCQAVNDHVSKHFTNEKRVELSPSTPSSHLCPLCDLSFQRLQQLQAHVNSHFEETKRRSHGSPARAVESPSTCAADVLSNSKLFEREFPAVTSVCRQVRAAWKRCYPTKRLVLCSHVDFFPIRTADRGFGCGYRNFQMLCSSLTKVHKLGPLLWKGRYGQSEARVDGATSRRDDGGNTDAAAPIAMPSISAIQRFLQEAWASGFDEQGKWQIGSAAGGFVGSRTWIGTSEVLALLSSFGIGALAFEFTRPEANTRLHPKLFEAVKHCFSKTASAHAAAALYLQHAGHSQTVIGYEMDDASDQVSALILLDPSWSAQTLQSALTASDRGRLDILRFPLPRLKHKQYQLVHVSKPLQTLQEFAEAKHPRGIVLS